LSIKVLISALYLHRGVVVSGLFSDQNVSNRLIIFGMEVSDLILM